MSAVPVASYLVEFAYDDGAPARSGAPARPVQAPLEREDVTARMEAAFSRGREAGRAEAAAEAEQRLVEARMRFAEERAAERLAWTHEQADRLCETLERALATLERTIASQTARVLSPLVEGGLRGKAVAELEAELRRLISHQEGLAIEASGPADLTGALRSRLAARGLHVTVAADEACELRVKAGHTVIETRLAAWGRRLEEALR